jgi:hypothetical protein
MGDKYFCKVFLARLIPCKSQALQNYGSYRAFHNFAKDNPNSGSENGHLCKQGFAKLILPCLIVLLQGIISMVYTLQQINHAKFLP